MSTIDFRKEPSYKAKTEPEIIKVPKMLFVMFDGVGGPESSDESNSEFQEAMQAVFGILFTIKFWDKKHSAPKGFAPFKMAPIEALWWMKDDSTFDLNRMGDWAWAIMLRLPEFVTPQFFQEVVDELIEKKKSDVYKRARLEYFEEGEVVQVLHIGPYANEGPTIQKMHQYAFEKGYKLTGKHHELYFGDPRRTAPEKLKTILRQPVEKD